MNTHLKLTTLALALAGIVGICAPAMAQSTRACTLAFARLDTNRDGGISPGEAPAPLRAKFQSVDADRDGRINAREYSACRTAGL